MAKDVPTRRSKQMYKPDFVIGFSFDKNHDQFAAYMQFDEQIAELKSYLHSIWGLIYFESIYD